MLNKVLDNELVEEHKESVKEKEDKKEVLGKIVTIYLTDKTFLNKLNLI